MRYLLDSDTCIFAMKGRESVKRRMQEAGPDECGISTVTAYELFHGIEKCQHPAVERRKVKRLLASVIVCGFDEEHAQEAAVVRAALEKRGEIIGPYDLLIAGHAKSVGATLVTHNTDEFKRVAGLKIEDWMTD